MWIKIGFAERPTIPRLIQPSCLVRLKPDTTYRERPREGGPYVLGPAKAGHYDYRSTRFCGATYDPAARSAIVVGPAKAGHYVQSEAA